MSEQDYEAKVGRLERMYTSTIAYEARQAVRQALGDGGETYRESVTDFAHNEVAAFLLNDERWVGVKATDISDIAMEAADAAWDAIKAES